MRKRVAHEQALWYEEELNKEIEKDRLAHGKKPLKKKDDNQPPASGGTGNDNMFRIITVCDDFHTFKDPEKFIREATRVLAPGGRLYIGEVALPEVLRIIANIPTYLISSKKSKFHSTYEILNYFKLAGLTKFRVFTKKRLLLVSAKKPV